MTQLDLFAAPVPALPPLPPDRPARLRELARRIGEAPEATLRRHAELAEEQAIAEAEAEAERGFDGYTEPDENEAGEVIEDEDEREYRARNLASLEAWKVESARISAAIEAARASGRTRTIQWGKVKDGKIPPMGGPAWYVEVFEHGGEAFIGRADYAMHNCGGSGGHRVIEGARTLDEGVLAVFRTRLDDCARATRDHGWQNTETKQCAQLAAWIIEQCPPLLYGVDLAAEYAAKRATYTAREKLRCAAIRANKGSYIGEDGRERSIYSV